MADEAVITTPVVTPTPVTSEPSVSTPVETSSPAVTPEVTPTPTETTTPVVTETAEAPAEVKTVLGEALDKPVEAETKQEITPEVKPEETQNEGGQSEETAPPPKYDPFTLPENVSLDESKIGEFTNLLAELETSGKATHEAVQAFGQKAVEFHINEIQKTISDYNDLLQKNWDKQKTEWRETFLKDPEIGGNRFQTTVDSALSFIKTHGGTPEQQKEFRDLMETSGLGNHPAMIRLLANAGLSMSEGKPLAAPKPVPQQRSRTQTLYGNK